MDTTQVIVIVVGVALIAFILWFFFGKQEGKKATASNGIQEKESVSVG